MLTVASPHPTDHPISSSYWPSHFPHPADRHISPFEGGRGDVNCQILTFSPSCWPSRLPLWRKSASWRSGVYTRGDVNRQTVTSPHPADHPISPSCWPSPLSVLLTITSPPLKGAGGMLSLQTVTSPHPADHHFSPFKGSPRAGAAEYVNRQIAKLTNRQIVKSSNLLIPQFAN